MKIPNNGYILPLWDRITYRATAVAYMQRENIKEVMNTNGVYYSLEQLKNALIQWKI